MLLEKLLKEFNFSINTFNLEESKLFDRYFERILISKDTFLIKEGEIGKSSVSCPLKPSDSAPLC